MYKEFDSKFGVILYFLLSFAVVYCAEYYLKLSSSAPAIEGVNVTLYADVYKSDGSRPKNETFSWVSWYSGDYLWKYLIIKRNCCWELSVSVKANETNENPACYLPFELHRIRYFVYEYLRWWWLLQL